MGRINGNTNAKTLKRRPIRIVTTVQRSVGLRGLVAGSMGEGRLALWDGVTRAIAKKVL